MRYEIIMQISIQLALQILEILTHEVSFYYARNLDFNFIGLLISNYASVTSSLQIFPSIFFLFF